MLSKPCVTALVDLIDNKLSSMAVTDRDDLREFNVLQRALNELQGLQHSSSSEAEFGNIPRRGRRRKVADYLARSFSGEHGHIARA